MPDLSRFAIFRPADAPAHGPVPHVPHGDRGRGATRGAGECHADQRVGYLVPRVSLENDGAGSDIRQSHIETDARSAAVSPCFPDEGGLGNRSGNGETTEILER